LDWNELSDRVSESRDGTYKLQYHFTSNFIMKVWIEFKGQRVAARPSNLKWACMDYQKRNRYHYRIRSLWRRRYRRQEASGRQLSVAVVWLPTGLEKVACSSVRELLGDYWNEWDAYKRAKRRQRCSVDERASLEPKHRVTVAVGSLNPSYQKGNHL
jgi:hypothetical protein